MNANETFAPPASTEVEPVFGVVDGVSRHESEASRFDCRAVVLLPRGFEVVDRATLAHRFRISEDTVDRWVKEGVFPQPVDPDRRVGRGRKLLRWDYFECVESWQRFKRC